MTKKENIKMTKEQLINLISPDVKSFLYDAHQETIINTIRDGKLSPKDKNYLPPDPLSLLKHHYAVLLDRQKDENWEKQFSGEKDVQILKFYTAGLEKSIYQRSMTKTMTDLLCTYTNLIMHIGIWITYEVFPDLHLTLYVTSRRKEAEGELIKILIKSVELAYTDTTNSISSIQPPIIRDLFGIRIIIDETDDPQILLKIMKIVVAILTNPLSEEFINFYNWVKTTNIWYGGSPIPKETLLPCMDYQLMMSHEKNYVINPKENGYNSWQATFTVQAPSPKACGGMFELQGRTREMHEKDEYGLNLTQEEIEKGLAHFDYKRAIKQLKKEIFAWPEDYSGGILFFNPKIGYDDEGISSCKTIASRTSSVHLISKS